MTETLYVQDDDPALPDREVTDATERAALMAEVVAETLLSHVEMGRGRDTKRVILSAANEAARRQAWTDALADTAERRSRTFQVFRRPAPGHAASPPEVPEVVTFGAPGDVFSPADLAQFRADFQADRLEPLP